MAEGSIAAKRDARRRKILLNSQARLEKITGRHSGADQAQINFNSDFHNGPVSEENTCALLSTLSSQVLEENHTHTVGNDKSDESLPKYRRDNTSTERDTLYFQHGFASTEEDSSASDLEKESDTVASIHPFLYVITSFKLHMIFLAILVRLLCSMNWDVVYGKNIFGPFFLVEISYLLVLKLSRSANVDTTGMIGAVLLLYGISPQVITGIMNAVSTISRLGGDFAIYFVTFILFHCAIEGLS